MRESAFYIFIQTISKYRYKKAFVRQKRGTLFTGHIIAPDFFIAAE